MNPVNMNLLQAIFINIFMFCLDTTAVSQGVAENATLKKDDSRKNYTASDLIFQLSKLATSNIIPRQRFPPNAYDYPDYPQQYPSYNDYPDTNEQYYDQDNLSGDYGPTNYPPNPFPYRRRPKKLRYPYPQYAPQYPFQDEPFPGGVNPYLQRPGSSPPFGSGSLFGSGPQFGSGSPFGSGFPFGSGPTSPFGQGPFNPYQEGPLESLTRALSSIARYDDQQCVPRLLCEVAAGGNPSGKQNSFLPSFLSMDSLFTLLSAFASDQVSPFLIFGRAAILGVTSQGNPSSCRYAYPECPRDPDRLVDYLNNHNGGFFRFFNGLQQDPGQFGFPQGEDQQGNYDQYDQNNQYDQNDQNYRPGQQYPQYSHENYNQRPDNYNQRPDNYNQRPDNYNQRPDNYNQRPDNYNQRPDNYNQRPDNYNQRPNNYNNQYNRKPGSNTRFPHNYESRILNVNSTEENEARIQNKPSIYSNQDLYISQSFRDPKVYTLNGHPLKFPEAATNHNPIVVPNLITNQGDPYATKTHLKFPSEENKKIKSLSFPGQEEIGQNQFDYYPRPLPFYDHSKMIFPDRTGTGNLKFDSEKLHHSTQRPDIYNKYYYSTYSKPNNYYQNQQSTYTKPNKYYNNQQSSSNYAKPINYYGNQQSSSQKYVYIVRGNGDPNHPEKVPIEYARQARLNEDVEVLEVEAKDGRGDDNEESGWKFPSAYQGVVYNDRSFRV